MKVGLIIVAIVLVVGAAIYLIAKPGSNTYGNTNTTNLQMTLLNAAANTNTQTSADAVSNSSNRNSSATVLNATNAGLNANTAATVNTNTSSTNASSNANKATVVNTNSTSTNTATAKTVSVTDSGFSPSSLIITLGQPVQWVNNRSSAVYVAPDNHPSHTKYAGIWDDTGAGQISPGQTYSFTFPQAGTYTYHDHLNPSQAGTIIVK